REPAADALDDGPQRAQLIERHQLQFLRFVGDVPPAEALSIRVADVRADADAPGDREAGDGMHRHRVAGVESAGDIGGADDLEQRRVVGHDVVAEAFAQVGVEVDRLHGTASCLGWIAPWANRHWRSMVSIMRWRRAQSSPAVTASHRAKRMPVPGRSWANRCRSARTTRAITG